MEEAAKRFLEIDLKIKEYNKAIKMMKEEKENAEMLLKKLMYDAKVEQINMDNYCIALRNMKHYGSLNKEYIEQGLAEFLKGHKPKESEEFATKATEHLLNNREVSEKSVVKVTTRR